MKRLVVGIAVAALVAVGAFFGWRYHVAHRVVPPRFTTVTIGRKNIVGKVTATGTLAATVTVTVGTQVSGRVDKLFVDFNSPVKKGQLVAKIDPLLFQAAVQQSQANYLQAQAAVEQAKANAAQADRQYARELALLKSNLAAQQDVDTAQTAAAVAKAGVDSSAASLAQAAASLNQAKVNLSYTDIISPIDGVVISRAVDVGQTVAASMSAPPFSRSVRICGKCRSIRTSPKVTSVVSSKACPSRSPSTRTPAKNSKGSSPKSETPQRRSRTSSRTTRSSTSTTTI